MATLKASTKALAANDPGDATYTSIEGQIQVSHWAAGCTRVRNKGAAQCAEFKGHPSMF